MIYGVLGAVGLSICAIVIAFRMAGECEAQVKKLRETERDNHWNINDAHIRINELRGEILNVNKNDISVNKSGCSDPTACQAIKNVDKETQRVHRLVEALRAVCAVAGFEIEGRIALRDKRTDKVWR